jgi:hypothetical protein
MGRLDYGVPRRWLYECDGISCNAQYYLSFAHMLTTCTLLLDRIFLLASIQKGEGNYSIALLLPQHEAKNPPDFCFGFGATGGAVAVVVVAAVVGAAAEAPAAGVVVVLVVVGWVFKV